MNNMSQFLISEIPGAMRQVPGDRGEPEPDSNTELAAARALVQATLFAHNSALREFADNTDAHKAVLDHLIDEGISYWAGGGELSIWARIAGTSRVFSDPRRPGAFEAGLRFLQFAGLSDIPTYNSFRGRKLLAGLVLAGLADRVMLSPSRRAGVDAALEELRASAMSGEARVEMLEDDSIGLQQTAGAAALMALFAAETDRCVSGDSSTLETFAKEAGRLALSAWVYAVQQLTPSVVAARAAPASGSNSSRVPAFDALAHAMNKTNIMGAATT